MGKAKRKHPDIEEILSRPWCYYCERDFDDLKILINHQKAKHFKCDRCGRRLNTAGGLSVHMTQVHKESLNVIENALPNRSGLEVEIFGMEGIPEDVVQAHQQRVLQNFAQAEAERRAATGNAGPGGAAGSQAKKPKFESPSDLKKRLAEHKAKVAAGEATGMGSGENTPSGAGHGSQSPGVGNGFATFAGSPGYSQPQMSFGPPPSNNPAFTAGPPQQPPFQQQPSPFPPQQSPFSPPGQSQFQSPGFPPNQHFQPPGGQGFQPQFMNGPPPPNFQNGLPPQFQNGPPPQFQDGPPPQFHNGPPQFQNGPPQFQNGPPQFNNGPPPPFQNGPPQFQNGAPPSFGSGSPGPPFQQSQFQPPRTNTPPQPQNMPQRPAHLPPAPGLPQRPSFGAPPVNAFQMQQMHQGQLPGPPPQLGQQNAQQISQNVNALAVGPAVNEKPLTAPSANASSLDDLVSGAAKEADKAASTAGPPTEAPKAEEPKEEKKGKKEKEKNSKLMYSDNETSPEEKMAKMPRYAFVPSG